MQQEEHRRVREVLLGVKKHRLSLHLANSSSHWQFTRVARGTASADQLSARCSPPTGSFSMLYFSLALRFPTPRSAGTRNSPCWRSPSPVFTLVNHFRYVFHLVTHCAMCLQYRLTCVSRTLRTSPPFSPSPTALGTRLVTNHSKISTRSRDMLIVT